MNRQSLLRNTVLLTTANLLLQILGLLFQIYLANTIGAVGMGTLQLVFTAGGFAVTLGISGTRVTAMNLTASHCGKRDAVGMKSAIGVCLRYGLVFSSVAGAALILLAPWIADTWIHEAQTAAALRIMGISLPVCTLPAILGGYFTARGSIKPLILIEAAEQLLCIGLTVLALEHWASNIGSVCLCVIGCSSVSALLSVIPLLLLLYRDLRRIPQCSASMQKPFFQLCVPLALGDYLRAALRTFEQFLIPRGLRSSMGNANGALAAYGTIGGMVFPVMMFPVVLFQSLSDLLVSELSRCKAQGLTMRIRHIVGCCLRVGLVFSAVITGLMALLSKGLCGILYDSSTAGQYLRMFSPMVLILYMDALTDGMLKGLGEQVAGVRYNTFTAAMDVALLLILLPKYGIMGYVISFAVTHIVNFYLSIRRLFLVTGFRSTVTHAAASVTVLLLTLLLCERLLAPQATVISVCLCGGIFLGLFFLLALPFGIVRPRELAEFLPRNKK